MRFMSRFYWILERKGYLEKITIYLNTMARGPMHRLKALGFSVAILELKKWWGQYEAKEKVGEPT